MRVHKGGCAPVFFLVRLIESPLIKFFDDRETLRRFFDRGIFSFLGTSEEERKNGKVGVKEREERVGKKGFLGFRE